jgi:hypothetical protein
MKNIHVLSTDKPSRLFVDIDDNKLKITQPLSGEYMMNQNIYITSDEEIKDVRPHKGKWQLEQEQILNKFPTYLTDLSECKLVIITTDQELIKDGVQAIDDTFLEWFVKNPNCEKIEIKTRYLHSYKTGENFISFSKTPEFSSRNMQCIKIEPRYEIIIPQEEPKQMSRQTAVEEFIKEILQDEFFTNIAEYKKAERLIEIGAKWQQEQQDNFVIGFLEYIEGTYSYSNIYDHWYLHSDTSKTYSKKELLKVYLKSKYYNETYKKDK